MRPQVPNNLMYFIGPVALLNKAFVNGQFKINGATPEAHKTPVQMCEYPSSYSYVISANGLYFYMLLDNGNRNTFDTVIDPSTPLSGDTEIWLDHEYFHNTYLPNSVDFPSADLAP